MNRDEIFDQLVTVLSDLFEISSDKIQLSSHLYEDLELDSIDAVDLVVELRKILQADIQPNVFKQVRTVQDVVDVVETLSNNK